MPNPTLAALAADLDTGRTSARQLVEECLARIADPAGEGQRTFIHVDRHSALEAADAMDRLRKANAAPTQFAGIPVSIKDLFDIRGQVTRAGSRALEDSAPAENDAPVVARLRRAGFVLIGRTNMTEFAYSGIGINPIVGYKPTQRRIPLEGGVPLSFSLDSFGPLANSVQCCATLDAALAGEPMAVLRPRPIKGMRLAVSTTIALDELDDAVAKTFERALEVLSRQGALIERIEMPELLDVGMMNAKGGFASSESYAWHRYLITSKGDDYDPRVSARILRGESMSAADYIDLLVARRSLVARAAERLASYDALVMPTTANTPPRIADLADDKEFTKANLRALRNCTLINMIDGCAISLPAHHEGEVPVGLMLASSGGSDHRIFELAAGMEAAVRV
jgi:aspartyl-tRNA(Asn)/glutamyl-tRNA(Gln) amidotransferase subunit A